MELLCKNSKRLFFAKKLCRKLTNCLSVFDHSVGLTLKGLTKLNDARMLLTMLFFKTALFKCFMSCDKLLLLLEAVLKYFAGTYSYHQCACLQESDCLQQPSKKEPLKLQGMSVSCIIFQKYF